MTSSEKGAAPLKLKRSDYRVLRSLNEDARKSHRTIARELSLSRKTVSKSIKFLEESGVILGYAPVIDAARIGYEVVAIIHVLFSTQIKVVLDTPNEFAKDSEVYMVLGTTGDWECMMMARFTDMQGLNTFVKKISGHINVDRVSVLVILNFVKDEKRIEI